MESELVTIQPSWSPLPGVHALTTTRLDGNSIGPYKGLNLARHVGDDPDHVRRNRQLLLENCALPSEPIWLQQVHGTEVHKLSSNSTEINPEADAVWTQESGLVCAIMTADCLPILLSDTRGQKIAAIHAGWRGLLAGIIEKTLASMQADTNNSVAWLGPAIGPKAFEVGDEVYQAFCEKDPALSAAFTPKNGKWLMDIYAAARQILQVAAVESIFGGDYCTFADSVHFYSYRRSGVTGRMATLIWKD